MDLRPIMADRGWFYHLCATAIALATCSMNPCAGSRNQQCRKDLTPGRLRISPVPIQAKSSSNVTVRVTAISLNRGEIKRALTVAEDGWRLGWDFTGIVEDTVAEGKGRRSEAGLSDVSVGRLGRTDLRSVRIAGCNPGRCH